MSTNDRNLADRLQVETFVRARQADGRPVDCREIALDADLPLHTVVARVAEILRAQR